MSIRSMSKSVCSWSFVTIFMFAIVAHSGSLAAQVAGDWVNDPTNLNVEEDAGGTWVIGLVNDVFRWNGNVLIGGRFDRVGGVPAQNVALWNGTQWSDLGVGLRGEVAAFAVWNGDLYAAGDYRWWVLDPLGSGSLIPIDGILAKFDAISGDWEYVGGQVQAGFINDMVVFDGKLWIAGQINNILMEPTLFPELIVSWDGSWGVPPAIFGGTTGYPHKQIFDLEVWDTDGSSGPNPSELYCGGNFSSVMAPPPTGTGGGGYLTIPNSRCLVKYNAGVNTFLGVSGGVTQPGGFGIVLDSVASMAGITTGTPQLYVGGSFSSVGNPGVAAWNIARLTGTTGVWSPLGGGVNAEVSKIIRYSGDGWSRLVVAGLFLTADGISVNGITRSNGTAFSTLQSGFAPSTFGMWVGGMAAIGTKLWVGGGFDYVGGFAGPISSRSIAIFDPAL